MFFTGTRVKVNEGENHGKRGTITEITLTGEGAQTGVSVDVLLDSGTTITGIGSDFTEVYR